MLGHPIGESDFNEDVSSLGHKFDAVCNIKTLVSESPPYIKRNSLFLFGKFANLHGITVKRNHWYMILPLFYTHVAFTYSKSAMEMFEIFLKLAITAPRRCHWRHFAFFNVNFEHILHIFHFEQVNVQWVC